jgi:ATP-dependent Clp protease ATP-binding subunit ClpA
MGAGRASEGPDAANLLKPALARGEMRVIGATTYAEFRLHVSKDPAFERRFHRIDVDAPSREQTLEILRRRKAEFEGHHGVSYSDEVLELGVNLAHRYLSGMQFPDKAIKVIDRMGAAIRVQNSDGKKRDAEVSHQDVVDTVAALAGVPPGRIARNESSLLDGIITGLRGRIIGQNAAVERIIERMRLVLTGLTRPGRPRTIMLFAGPSGVGKTESARIIADTLFADQRRLLAFDMTEYTTAHSVTRLIGADPGTIGYELGGRLTEAVWKSGHSLVLLDEFEKADPAVIRLFLQVFDEGRLTDNKGRTVRFDECLFILTTNDRALWAREGAQARIASSAFPPEVLSRVDEIIPFHALAADQFSALTNRFLAGFGALVAGDGKAPAPTFRATKAAQDAITAEGFDQALGARALRVYLESKIFSPLIELHPRIADLLGSEILIDRTAEGKGFSFAVSRHAADTRKRKKKGP